MTTEDMSRQQVVSRSVWGTVVVTAVTLLRFGFGFGSQLLLARLLLPADFGVMSFSWMVVGFLGNLAHLQSQRYIIHRREEAERIVHTTYLAEIGLSLLIFGFTFGFAPWITHLFGKPEQAVYVQVLALTIFFYPFQQLRALLERDLDFRRASLPDVAGIVLSAVVAIGLAYTGAGVWSLIWGKLVQFGVQIVGIVLVSRYRPVWAFDVAVLKDAWRFGWPLVGSGILVYFYWNVDYYLVGRYLGDEQLGYYWLAYQVTHYLLQLKDGINKVAYPAFASLKSDEDMRRGFIFLSRYTALLFLLPTVVFWVLGRETVTLVFGTTWLPSLGPFRVFVLVTALRATLNYWEPVLLTRGQTRVLLWATVMNAALLPLLGYFLTRRVGIQGTAVAVLLTILLSTPYLAYHLRRQLQISYVRTLWPVFPVMVSTMGLGFLLKMWWAAETWPTYIGFVIILSLVYLALAFWWIVELQQDVQWVYGRFLARHHTIG